MNKTFLFFLICLMAVSCLKEEDPFQNDQGIDPFNMNDGWQISTPADENMDSQALAEIYRDLYDKGELWQLRSLLVFRHSKLIAESYFKDTDDMTKPMPIWSCTKQIVGLLTGIAIEQGSIDSVNSPISTYLGTEMLEHPDKANITIGHLLTMKAGINFDESGDVSALLQKKPQNVIEFILEKPLQFDPGTQFSYNSGETHLIAASLQNAVSRPLADWADDVLFSKIGFNNYTWLEYDGYNFGGYGISTTPRELAKIAQLVLNEGTWNGEAIVNPMWIEQMVTTQTVTYDSSDYTFGYLWWINEAENIHFMSGSGGQYACVIPDKDLLVVAMSEHDTDGDLELDFDTFLTIVQRIRDTAYE